MSRHSSGDTDIRDLIRQAAGSDEVPDDIVQELRNKRFDTGVSEERIRRVVRRAAYDETNYDEELLSQPPSTARTPREPPDRYVTHADIAYLSDREFARVLGAVFEWFSGGTIRTSGIDTVVLDLYWNRQHTTVGFRTVSTSPQQAVSETVIRDVIEGDITREGGRSPSTVALVTTGELSSDAADTADTADIEVFSKEHLAAWLRRVRMPMAVLGTVLEEGEKHSDNISDLVELPPAPSYASDIDPLAIDPAAGHTMQVDVAEPEQDSPGLDSDEAATSKIPVDEDTPSLGETGVLYADPQNDGDYDAFDRFVEGIEMEDDQ